MTTIEEILSDFNPKVIGDSQIRMQCPFRENHEGKYAFGAGDGTKSFFLNTDKNTYHCFSCHAKGKVTTLLQKRFDVSLFRAVELVNLLGVEAREKEEYELDFSWDITPPEMFLKRGITAETLKHFRTGVDEKGAAIIPCFDERNNLKGVKFRKGRDFWYSENFDKKNYLYNYRSDYDWAILVEGETDVYRLYDWGYNVIGLLTSSLTDEQVEMVAKIPRLYGSLDCDSAGIKGMHKMYQQLKNRTDLSFINYPASDPCDCGRRDYRIAFHNAVNYGEFKLKTLDLI